LINGVAASPDLGQKLTSIALSALILVVDDNRDSAESMASLLKISGHRVSIAFDGNKAVEIAIEERPQIVLMDVGLPGLNGHQACRLMRERGLKDAFIVAMTGYGQDDDRRQSRDASFDAHLVKPIDYISLQAIILRAVESLDSKI